MSSFPVRSPPLSRSAIVADAMSGSHILTVHGYSLTKDLGLGKCITSSSFVAGGNRWCLQYYPDGTTTSSGGGISIHLVLDSSMEIDAVTAQYKISLLDKDENPVPMFIRGSDTFFTFSGEEPPLGDCKFISKEDLESSGHLKDDAFSVRCDITVMEIKIKDILTTPAVGSEVAGELLFMQSGSFD